MNIILQNVGKRFERNWIFRNISQEFKEGGKYAILGPNGSGKSTLLKAISGNLTITEGNINYKVSNSDIPVEDVFKYLTIAAPYLDIPEEYSLQEIIDFHRTFKKINHSTKEIITKLELEHTKDKQYKRFSSGMKQRVKLGLAIMSDASLLLLDEPSTALDANATKWYQALISDYSSDKTILVFSNNKEEEYKFCNSIIQLNSYEPKN